MNFQVVNVCFLFLILLCNSMPFESITGSFKRCSLGICTRIEKIYFVSNNCTKSFPHGWHVWFIVNNKKCYGLVGRSTTTNNEISYSHLQHMLLLPHHQNLPEIITLYRNSSSNQFLLRLDMNQNNLNLYTAINIKF